MLIRILLFFAALVSVAQAAPVELRSLKAVPKGLLKAVRVPTKSRFYQVKGAEELIAVSFVNRGSGWLELYGKKASGYSRISIVEFPNLAWTQQEIGATGLSENPKRPRRVALYVERQGGQPPAAPIGLDRSQG